MSDFKMEIKWLDPKELTPYVNNSKKHSDEQIDKLAGSIAAFGFDQPVVVDRERVIVKGHGRREAALRLGLKSIPVVFADHLDENQIRAARIADNKLSSLEYDVEKLSFDIGTLERSGFDLNLTGIEFDEIKGLLSGELGGEKVGAIEPVEGEDDVPEDVITRTKLGDIYQLGDHRLMCGDSTDVECVRKLMDGQIASITFTSPPYNAGKNLRGNFYKNDSDDKSDEDYVTFLSKVTSHCINYSEFSFFNLQILESNKRALILYQYNFLNNLKDILIWNKKNYPPHINKGTFGCKWEYVLAFSKIGKSRSFPCSWQGKFSNVIDTENNSVNEFASDHKAGFPVSFPEWMITKMDFSKSVLDPFGGTGTTLIACEKTNRRCFMMELDPHYCDVIVARWEQFTGKTAELLTPHEPS